MVTHTCKNKNPDETHRDFFMDVFLTTYLTALIKEDKVEELVFCTKNEATLPKVLPLLVTLLVTAG